MARPKSKYTLEILDRALFHVESVPYDVTLRWVFYRLWQEGLLQKKWKQGWKENKKTKELVEFEENDNHYKERCSANLTGIFSSARKKLFRGWKRDTLIDDSRNIIWRGVGFMNKEEWLESLECTLDKFQSQDYFIMILYEAEAMTQQFKFYTKNIPLVPFKGDASIYYKNSIAKEIEWANEKYSKPVVILYFGDYDKKGEQIRKTAEKDIKEWCKVKFEFKHCGLTEQQVIELKIIGSSGKFQWESLSDEQAKKIIEENVEEYQDKSRFVEIEEREEKVLEELKGDIS